MERPNEQFTRFVARAAWTIYAHTHTRYIQRESHQFDASALHSMYAHRISAHDTDKIWTGKQSEITRAENWTLFANFGLTRKRSLTISHYFGAFNCSYFGCVYFRGGIETMNRLRIFENHYLYYLSVCHRREIKEYEPKTKTNNNNNDSKKTEQIFFW